MWKGNISAFDQYGAGRGFSTPSALKEPGVVGVASELVSTEVEYESLIEYLLGRTLVVGKY